MSRAISPQVYFHLRPIFFPLISRHFRTSLIKLSCSLTEPTAFPKSNPQNLMQLNRLHTILMIPQSRQHIFTSPSHAPSAVPLPTSSAKSLWRVYVYPVNPSLIIRVNSCIRLPKCARSSTVAFVLMPWKPSQFPPPPHTHVLLMCAFTKIPRIIFLAHLLTLLTSTTIPFVGGHDFPPSEGMI